MSALLLGLAAFLLVNLAAGLVRVMRGPTAADRMLAVQLFGTTAVAVVLLLAEAQQEPGVHNVALVFALLAAVASVAFVQRIWGRGRS